MDFRCNEGSRGAPKLNCRTTIMNQEIQEARAELLAFISSVRHRAIYLINRGTGADQVLRL
jgi:hypothetical protein